MKDNLFLTRKVFFTVINNEEKSKPMRFWLMKRRLALMVNDDKTER